MKYVVLIKACKQVQCQMTVLKAEIAHKIVKVAIILGNIIVLKNAVKMHTCGQDKPFPW